MYAPIENLGRGESISGLNRAEPLKVGFAYTRGTKRNITKLANEDHSDADLSQAYPRQELLGRVDPNIFMGNDTEKLAARIQGFEGNRLNGQSVIKLQSRSVPNFSRLTAQERSNLLAAFRSQVRSSNTIVLASGDQLNMIYVDDSAASELSDEQRGDLNRYMSAIQEVSARGRAADVYKLVASDQSAPPVLTDDKQAVIYTGSGAPQMKALSEITKTDLESATAIYIDPMAFNNLMQIIDPDITPTSDSKLLKRLKSFQNGIVEREELEKLSLHEDQVLPLDGLLPSDIYLNPATICGTKV